jgi:hypothetical protein
MNPTMTETSVALADDRAIAAPMPTDSILGVIERAARDPGVDVGKMQVFMDATRARAEEAPHVVV